MWAVGVGINDRSKSTAATILDRTTTKPLFQPLHTHMEKFPSSGPTMTPPSDPIGQLSDFGINAPANSQACRISEQEVQEHTILRIDSTPPP